MKMQRGHLLPVVAISLMAAALPALAETVTVNTVTTALPGETVGQMVARVTPLLQDMALKQQRGTLARVTSDDGNRMDRQLQMVQGGIVDSQLVSVTSADSGQMRVTMSFDLDMKSGQEYGQMSAQNMTLKAHLGELSDAAASNPVSRAALSDEAKRKYESMASISGTTSTVRSGLATSKLGGQVKLANTTVCNRDYQVVSVKDFSIQPGLNDTVNAQATVVVKAIVDDCAEHHFTVGSWLGQTRTMTVIGFGRGSYSGNLSNADPEDMGFAGQKYLHYVPGELVDTDRRLTADSGDRTTHLNWGYKILDTVQSENEVVFNYHVEGVPRSLLTSSDELIFKVVPGA